MPAFSVTSSSLAIGRSWQTMVFAPLGGGGAAGCPAYDTEQLTWRHLSFFQHEAYLTARVPRISCQDCGIRQVSVPSVLIPHVWPSGDSSGLTLPVPPALSWVNLPGGGVASRARFLPQQATVLSDLSAQV